MRSTFQAVDEISSVRAIPKTPQNGAVYPGSDLGQALNEAARIIRGDVGVEIITIDQGDWDMHTGLGTIEWGGLKDNAAEFADSVSAFFTDLGLLGDKVTLVSLSEFGRRVQENENYGTDHGYGNAMFVAGAGVSGGYKGSGPGSPTTTTPTCWSPPTTAACWPRSWRRASTPASRPSSRASPAPASA